MKKIVLAVMTTISGLVMLFSYHTSTQSVAATTPRTPTPAHPADAGTTTRRPARRRRLDGLAVERRRHRHPSGGDGTYTGDAVQTRWGTVQVEITVANGTITSADADPVPELRTARTSRSTPTPCRS